MKLAPLWVGCLACVSSTLPAATTVPAPLLRMTDGSYAILVDKAQHRLDLYRWDGGGPLRIRTHAATTGKSTGDKSREGDERTPEGIYFFTRFISGTKLPREYGDGAIVMNYPNAFDRLEGNTGDGIWLHATDDPQRTSQPFTTRGCVVVQNGPFREVEPDVVLRYTPIIIGERIEEIPIKEMERRRAEASSFVERWRAAWEAGDLASYLASYDPHFHGMGMDYPRFAAHKTEVIRRSHEIRVDLTDLQIFRLGDRMVLHFFQNFRSSLTANFGYKTMHVIRAAGEWRILSEELDPASTFRSNPAILARATPPVEVTAPIRTVAAVVPQPHSGMELLGTDTRTVRVEGLRADESTKEQIEISFELRNSDPSGPRVTGRLAVILSRKTGDEIRQVVYPDLHTSEVPPASELMRQGEFFSIQRFKIVHALFPKQGPGGPTSDLSAKVCVYDHSGRPLLIKDFPLADPAGLSGVATAAAGASWKASR